MRKHMVLTATLLAMGIAGCSSKAGNVAVGAGAVGAAYEYQNKQAMDELERDRKAGKISQEEYDRRKREIEKRSLIQ
jgi:membrane-bound lytic murein transglycosylase B